MKNVDFNESMDQQVTYDYLNENQNGAFHQILPFSQLVKFVNPKPKVEASSKGFDESASCLLSSQKNDSKWCVNFVSGKNWVNFTFVRPIELHGFAITFADDFAARDPIQWNL